MHPAAYPYSPHDFMGLIRAALAEDVGTGDVTSLTLIPEHLEGVLAFNARQPLVVAGGEIARAVFSLVDARITVDIHQPDGEAAMAGETLLTARGPARGLLTAERVALNLLQRASSVATLTREYVNAVAGTGAVILDTRKTMPGLRLLDKYAVACGGGRNHRMGLYDAIMIKDNHIALASGIGPAIARAKAGAPGVPVIVECDTLSQVAEALAVPTAPDRILLDNMTIAGLMEAVAMAGGRVKLEVSGGVNLATVRAIAETGVDYISVGALTHSATGVDIGADVAW